MSESEEKYAQIKHNCKKKKKPSLTSMLLDFDVRGHRGGFFTRVSIIMDYGLYFVQKWRFKVKHLNDGSVSTLSSLGITGILLRWFESYLTGRSFRVAWGGEVSKAHQLVTGVPQGSVLGPLLFSIYIYIYTFMHSSISHFNQMIQR